MNVGEAMMTTLLPTPTDQDIIEACATDADIIASIAEVLREPGARLVGDSRFFSKTVQPLYDRSGYAVDETPMFSICWGPGQQNHPYRDALARRASSWGTTFRSRFCRI